MSATPADAPTAMWIIPHTHWDREWYEPHDVFRARLVRMIDGLLDLLEREGAYRFTLDGQAAAFEDYLAIRPHNRERLRAAVDRGQLAIGPFLILLDEFCCDGETTVRNLELGIRSCRAMGGEMRVSYLPDMFGHAAQMPQVLCGFDMSVVPAHVGISGVYGGISFTIGPVGHLLRLLDLQGVDIETKRNVRPRLRPDQHPHDPRQSPSGGTKVPLVDPGTQRPSILPIENALRRNEKPSFSIQNFCSLRDLYPPGLQLFRDKARSKKFQPSGLSMTVKQTPPRNSRFLPIGKTAKHILQNLHRSSP